MAAGLAAAALLVGQGLSSPWVRAEGFRKIAELELSLVGVSAHLDPPSPTFPKNVAAGARVVVQAGGGELSAADVERFLGGSFQLRAELSGPGLGQTLSLPIDDPDRPPVEDPLILAIPPLPVAGEYQLSGIRFEVGGETVLDVAPGNALVQVIDQVLVTSVRTRPLTLAEIEQKGIVLDSDDYLGFEFTLGLKLESDPIDFSFPVVFDREGVPVPTPISPPPAPFRETARLPTIVPMLLEVEDPPGDGPQEPRRPPRLPSGQPIRIPSVIVIPGNVGYLKQFFEAKLFVANGAPGGSGLSVRDIEGRLKLPPGADLVLGTADDPLALPELMRDGEVILQPETLPVRAVGPDGVPATADDVGHLAPGEQGEAEFLIRGEREGFHTLGFDIVATLDGLPTGAVTVRGSATGGVLVRNPYFDVTFTVPSIVREGERFPFYVTVTNIGESFANDVTVTLDVARMSGAKIASGDPADAVNGIDTLFPGDSQTLEFTFEGQRTGQVVASYLRLDTEDGSQGDIQFTLSVGERGVPLSPDTLVLPTAVDALATGVVDAAMRVLGQAWSIATAAPGTLPRDVERISQRVVTQKALALAEAGLRVRLGQEPNAAVRDLLVDFHGGDARDPGFDQLLRETRAGHTFDAVLGAALRDPAVGGDALAAAGGLLAWDEETARLLASGPDFLGLVLGSSDGAPPVRATLVGGGGGRSEARPDAEIPVSEVPGALWSTLGAPTDAPLFGLVQHPLAGPYVLELEGVADGALDLAVSLPSGDGAVLRAELTGVPVTATTLARLVLDLDRPEGLLLEIDADGDGVFDAQQVLSSGRIDPEGPRLVSASVIGPETLDGAGPFGLHAVALFDRVVEAESGERPEGYAIPKNAVAGAKRQLSGRFVFLSLEQPEGPYVPTTVSVSGVRDARGATGPDVTVDLGSQLEAPGAVVSGRVFTAEGIAVDGAVVTYTGNANWETCQQSAPVGLAATTADLDGRYELRYVYRDACGQQFNLLTRDPGSGSLRSVSDSVRVPGERIVHDFAMFGRGSVQGVVKNLAGAAVAGARVVVVSQTDPQVGGEATTDGAGFYRIDGITVGPFQVTAGSGSGLGRSGGRIDRAGTVAAADVTLDGDAVRVSGTVYKSEGGGQATPVPNVGVLFSIPPPAGRAGWQVLGYVATDGLGGFAFEGMPVGEFRLEAALNTRDRVVVGGTAILGQDVVQDLLIEVQPETGYGTARGHVVSIGGDPAPGVTVVVAGRGTLTDGNGAFEVGGIPVRPGVAQRLEARTRDGRRSAFTNVIVSLPGEQIDGLLLELSGVGTAAFRVTGPEGAVGGQQVALLGACLNPCGCAVAITDADGIARFPNQPLGLVRARAFRTEGSFIDVADSSVSITSNGQEALGQIAFAGAGVVKGRVLEPAADPDGPPIPSHGAQVELYSNSYDFDYCTLRSQLSHRMRTGTDGLFEFTGVGVGRVSVRASQDFLPTPVGAQDVLTRAGDVAEFELELVDTIAGELSGTVYLPDGETPAGAGIEVTANGPLPDVVVLTDQAGLYRFAEILPQGLYTLTFRDAVTGAQSQERVFLRAGEDTTFDTRLLGRGTVEVRVVDGADGPVGEAFVRLKELDFPRRTFEGAVEPANEGLVVFEDVFEGRFSVEASDPFARGGRVSGTLPAPDATVEARVRLTTTGVVTGLFTLPDGSPIPFATVEVFSGGRAIGQATTGGSGDALGRFRFDYVPAGSIRVEAQDPLTGRTGLGQGVLETEGQVLEVPVEAQRLGSVSGYVTLNGARLGGVHVCLTSGSFGVCSLTTAEGDYRLDGVPEGRVVVKAQQSGGFAGTASGTLEGEGTPLELPVALRSAGSIAGTVTNATGDGAPPAAIVTLQVGGVGGSQQTAVVRADGTFSFALVPVGVAQLTVDVLGTIDRASGSVEVREGEEARIALQLQGVGSIRGTAVDSGGVDGVAGTLTFSGGAFPYAVGLQTGNEGTFYLPEVLAGEFTAKLRTLGLAGGISLYGTETGVVEPGVETALTVRVQETGTVIGSVVRADGATPAFGAEVTVDLGAGRGRVTVQVPSGGGFEVTGVPLGDFDVRVFDPVTAGRAVVGGRSVSANGEVVDLAVIRLDDDPPAVTFLTPVEGETRAAFGGDLEVELVDEASGLDLASFSVVYPVGSVGAGGFAFDGGVARGALDVARLVAGPNLLTARVTDLSGNVGEAAIRFTITGGSVRAVVRNADDSEANGVPVTIGGQPAAFEGSGGLYRRSGLKPGTYTVVATDPLSGLTASASGVLPDGGEVDVPVQLPAFASIAGTVTRPRDGAGVAGVEVVAGPRSAVTGPDGAYRLDGLPLGTYTLQATDPVTGDHGDATAVLTALGQEVPAPIELNGNGSVTVTVTVPGGGAVGGATVSLTSDSRFGFSETRTTDASGTAAFPHVLAGLVTARAVLGARDGDAQAVLADGDALALPVELEPAGRVAGVVSRNGGGTAAGVEVRLTGTATGLDVTGALGAFAFDAVPLGSVTVDATDPATGDRGRRSGVLAGDGDTLDLSLALNGTGSIRVEVREAGPDGAPGPPVAGARVTVTGGGPFGGSAQVTADASGEALFEHFLAGPVTVKATDTATGISGSVDAELAPGQALDVPVLLQPVASLEGVVSRPSGAAVAGAQVRAGNRTAITDAGGAYRLDDLKLGDYTVDVRIDGRLRARGTATLATAGEVVTRNLVTVGTGTVSGVVLDGTAGVEGARVDLRSQASLFGGAFTTTSGPGGSFEIGDVPVGPFTATATRGPDQAVDSGEIVQDGEQVVLELKLLSTAVNLPALLRDGNGLGWRVQTDAGVTHGPLFASAGPRLTLVEGGVERTFAGSGSPVASEEEKREIVTRETGLGSLDVTRKVFVPLDGYFVRYLTVLENPGAAPVRVSVVEQTSLGATEVVASASGDAALTAEDAWVLLDDADTTDIYDTSNPDTALAPLAWVAYGPGGTAPTSASFEGQVLRWSWDGVEVPPGGQVALLQVFSAQADRARGHATAERLAALPPELLAGLIPEDGSAVLNFALAGDLSSALEALPPNDGRVSGVVYGGDGVTPVRSRFGGDRVVFRSLSPHYGRPLSVSSNGNGVYAVVGDPANPFGASLVPRTAFELDARYFSRFGSITWTLSDGGDFETTGPTDLGALGGLVLSASSEYSASYTVEKAFDGDLQTSWFAANNDAANVNPGNGPWVQVEFPMDVRVDGVQIRGERLYGDTYSITRARVEVLDGAGALLASSEVDLPLPSRDADVDLAAVVPGGVTGARRVRVVSLEDQSIEPGLAEVIVIGAPSTAVTVDRVARDLVFDQTGVVRGSVRRSDGTPIANAQVRLSRDGVTAGPDDTSGEAFHYALLEPGEYDLLATTIAGVTLDVPGIAVAAGAATIADAVFPAFGAVEVHLETAAGSAASGWTRVTGSEYDRTVFVGASGTVFEDVPSGEYTVTATDGRNQAVVTGSASVAAGPATPVSLAFPPNGTLQVTARVEGQALASANVYWDSTSRSGEVYGGRTDVLGRRTVTNVAGPTVTVRVVHPQGDNAVSGSRTVSLTTEGQTVDVDVDVPGVGTLQGTLRSTSGTALSGRADLVRDRTRLKWVSVPASGAFTLTGVPSAPLRLQGRVQVLYSFMWIYSRSDAPVLVGGEGQTLVTDAVIPQGVLALEGESALWQLEVLTGDALDIVALGIEESGQPALADPFLELIRPDGTTAATADDGLGSGPYPRLQWTADQDGTWLVKVRSAGPGTGGYRLGSRSDDYRHAFAPYAGPRIEGRVSDELGAPQADLEVRLLRDGQPAGVTRTGTDGRYTLPFAPPASWAVEVVDAAGVVIGREAGTAVAGESPTADVVVPARGEVTVTVTRSGAGLGVAGAGVTLQSDHPSALPADGARSGVTDAGGALVRVLPAGTITATVTDPDHTGVERTATGALAAGGSLALSVELPAGVTSLTGFVTNVSGDGIPGAVVELAGAASAGAGTDAAGFYCIDGVVPGSYTLTASFGAVSTARAFAAVGGEAVESFTLAVPMLRGRVTEADGSPAAAAVRLCGPLAAGGFDCLESTTDAAGDYLLIGWLPWQVNGRLTPSARPLDDPNVLVTAPWFTHRPTLGLSERADMAFPPAGALIGRVTDDGRGVAGAIVAAYRGFSGLGSGQVTDADGYYSFPRLSPGPVTVFANDPESIPGEASGDVVAGESRTLDVTLIATGTLDVSVEDTRGALLAGGVLVESFDPPRQSPFFPSWLRFVELVDPETGDPAARLVRVPPGPVQVVDRGDPGDSEDDGPSPAAVADVEVRAGEVRPVALVRGTHLNAIPTLETAADTWGRCADWQSDCPYRRPLDLGGPSTGELVKPELAGRQFESAVGVSDGLWSRKVTYLPPSGAFWRELLVVENRGTEPAQVPVGALFEPFPHLDWELVATSSGDAVWDATDGWMLAQHPEGHFTAVVTGSEIPADDLTFVPGADYVEFVQYALVGFDHVLDVPPGETRAFLAFRVERLGPPQSEMEALLQSLLSLSHPDALVGLTPAERQAIANFVVPAPGVELTGRLLDGGAGVPGARVALVAGDGSVRAEAVTGVGGSFRLVGFGPGDFDLVGFDPVTGRAGRTAMSFAAGEAQDVDLPLDAPLADLQVEGVAAGGVVLEGLQVAVRFPGWGGIADRYAWLDADGRADLGPVPAGAFEIEVGRRAPDVGSAQGVLAAAEQRTVEVEVGPAEPPPDVVADLEPPAALAGPPAEERVVTRSFQAAS